MQKRHELFSNLSSSDISSTLSACMLLDKEEYTEEEADRFRSCRASISQGKTYKQVAAHFRRIDRKVKASDVSDESEAMLDISELLALASDQCKQRISLKEVGQILDSCGLADKDQYTSDEGDRFLEACELIKLQAKSLEEVAAHFGIEKVTPPQTPKQLQQLLAEMGELTMLNESDLLSLVERVTLERSQLLEGMVSQSYLRNATERFKQDKANTTMLFAELEQRVLDYMEGKRPAQSLRETWDWEPNSLPPSSPKPMSLPEGSLNGTNDF